ncbi:MAG: PqqD family protein [Pyrinomonadaceae bacterium]|nr:PqqD family protein [Pyrinomonadaceae bacterium]
MKPIARTSGLLIAEETGELFIHDLRTASAICLNPTSAYVWQKCDGKHESRDIAREMQQELGVPVSEDVVLYAIDRLSSESLIEFAPQFSN